MQIAFNTEIKDSAVAAELHRLINQIYKLLPCREEGEDWQKPLETLIEEIAGMNDVLIGQHEILFPLLCKMQGLTLLVNEEDFSLYRRTIFECLSLLGDLKNQCQL